MSYKKIDFKDYPDKTMPVSAENLNMLQDNLGLYLVPTGGIVEFAGIVAPNGWLMCDGSEISRTTYADLFEAIGTTFGEGDGSTTFNLPNRKGKAGVGVDSSNDKFGNLGDTYGTEEHQLTIAEMPEHRHSGLLSSNGGEVTVYGTTSGGNEEIVDISNYYKNGTKNSTMNTKYTGSGKPHNNIQPSIAMNYIIKV